MAPESGLDGRVCIVAMARIELLIVIEDLVMAGGSHKLKVSGVGHAGGVCVDGVVEVVWR